MPDLVILVEYVGRKIPISKVYTFGLTALINAFLRCSNFHQSSTLQFCLLQPVHSLVQIQDNVRPITDEYSVLGIYSMLL